VVVPAIALANVIEEFSLPLSILDAAMLDVSTPRGGPVEQCEDAQYYTYLSIVCIFYVLPLRCGANVTDDERFGVPATDSTRRTGS